MHRSLVDKEWIDSFMHRSDHPLPLDAHQRFFSVLRVKPDEIVAVFDGHGRQVMGRLILDSSKKQSHFIGATLEVIKPLLPPLILIQAAVIENKLEQTIQRGSEIGIDEFIIFAAERSEPFCLQKLEKKHERLFRIAEDASRQCGRLFIPKITFRSCLKDIVEERDDWLGFYGQLDAPLMLTKALTPILPLNSSVAVVVGPEGGLSDLEFMVLKKSSFLGVRWSPYTLRSELAGVFAMALVQGVLGRG